MITKRYTLSLFLFSMILFGSTGFSEAGEKPALSFFWKFDVASAKSSIKQVRLQPGQLFQPGERYVLFNAGGWDCLFYPNRLVIISDVSEAMHIKCVANTLPPFLKKELVDCVPRPHLKELSSLRRRLDSGELTQKQFTAEMVSLNKKANARCENNNFKKFVINCENNPKDKHNQKTFTLKQMIGSIRIDVECSDRPL